MTERKVLNKYFPPDFDPEKLITRKRFLKTQGDTRRCRSDGKQMNVRMMMPFTMCCRTCGEFVYIGTKFNSRVEKVRTEDYLGIVIWRFYGKCPHCRAELSFKTDPKNTDYVLESGGTRIYESHKDIIHAETELNDQLAQDLEGDAMKALEYKTYNTANELLAIEQLDELRKLNKRLLNREQAVDHALDWLNDQSEEQSDLTAEETQLLSDAKQEMYRPAPDSSSEEELPSSSSVDGSLEVFVREGSTETGGAFEGEIGSSSRQRKNESVVAQTGATRTTLTPRFVVKKKAPVLASCNLVGFDSEGSDDGR